MAKSITWRMDIVFALSLSPIALANIDSTRGKDMAVPKPKYSGNN